MSESVEIKVARLEERVEALTAVVTKMGADLEKVVTFTTEVRGGKKALYALWCAIGAVLVWAIDHVPGWIK